jgi:hypothetical protein
MTDHYISRTRIKMRSGTHRAPVKADAGEVGKSHSPGSIMRGRAVLTSVCIRADLSKTATADRIIRKGIETRNACISFQIVQECLNTMLRKAEISLNTDETKQYLDNVLAPLFRVPASLSLYRRARSPNALPLRLLRLVGHRSRPRCGLHPTLQRELARRTADRRIDGRESVS